MQTETLTPTNEIISAEAGIIKIMNEQYFLFNQRKSDRKKIVKSYSQKELWARTATLIEALIAEKVNFPISNVNLALLEKKQEEYLLRKQVALLNEPWLPYHFAVIRSENMTGEKVSPNQFRRSARVINRALIKKAIKEFGLEKENTVIVAPYRAGCFPALEAYKMGFTKILGIDVKRDESNAKKKAYVSYVSQMPKFNSSTKFLITEPMNASGDSMSEVLQELLQSGVATENIFSVHAITSPEGVVRIVEEFGIQMIIGAMDECLNVEVFITGTGIGDYGDLSCEGLSPKWLAYFFRCLFSNLKDKEQFLTRVMSHKNAA